MIKFNFEGQGYFNFLEKNCTNEFVEILRDDLDSGLGSVILYVDHSVSSYWGFDSFKTIVYVTNDTGSLSVYSEFNCPAKQIIDFETNFMPVFMIKKFKELGVI